MRINISTVFKYFDRGNWLLCMLSVVSVASSCKKFVQVNPPSTSVAGSTVFASNSSAAAAMTSIYDNMISNTLMSSGGSSISLLEGLAADELTNYDASAGNYSQFYSNNLNSSTSEPGWWNEIYQEIHVANAVIEGLSSSTSVSQSIKTQLTGEAKFIRAFFHFYATNLYGDVPLVLTTDYRTNNSIKRAPQAQVYQQIIQDLKDAQTALNVNFLDSYGNKTNARVRPNRGAATALLARAYLYLGQWDSAEAQSTAIISNASTYKLVSNLNNVFLANSTEAIWQLQPVYPNTDTWDAQSFVLTSSPGSGAVYVSLDSNLIATFEPGDLRDSDWVGIYTDPDTFINYYFPYKYKLWDYDPNAPSEYGMVFRLAEQYLIRAEARAQQGNFQGAQADINVIRTRAGLFNTAAGDKTSLLNAVAHERRVELFTEWGHRWFDLIRTARINNVMGAPGNASNAKGGTWNPQAALMPIPQSEIQINSNLTQNPGYN